VCACVRACACMCVARMSRYMYRDGATALHFAADKGYYEIVEMLLVAGAVHQCDNKNISPSSLAQVIPRRCMYSASYSYKLIAYQSYLQKEHAEPRRCVTCVCGNDKLLFM